METTIDSNVRLRRRRFAFIRVADESVLDIRRFLQGEIAFQAKTECTLLCPVRGSSLRLTADEIGLMVGVPADRWMTHDELQAAEPARQDRLLDLARRGILLCDPAPEGLDGTAAAEDLMEQMQWLDVAALHHGQSKWRGVDSVLSGAKTTMAEKANKIPGGAPGHFFQRRDAIVRTPLQVPKLEGAFFETLFARCTTRAWQSERPLPKSVLETMLYTVFGAHGIKHIPGNIALIKRTSPSGGALHPIDAYVLVNNVDGVSSGLYHYEGASHTLALLEGMSAAQARDLGRVFTAGQTYFAEAHVLFIHVARFDREFWKYQRHRKAYKAVLMDSGHLSQTLYLTATYLGLGAFYTVAINDTDIESRLRLRPIRDAVIAINGFGIPIDGRDEFALDPDPYRPNRAVTNGVYDIVRTRMLTQGEDTQNGSTNKGKQSGGTKKDAQRRRTKKDKQIGSREKDKQRTSTKKDKQSGSREKDKQRTGTKKDTQSGSTKKEKQTGGGGRNAHMAGRQHRAAYQGSTAPRQ